MSAFFQSQERIRQSTDEYRIITKEDISPSRSGQEEEADKFALNDLTLCTFNPKHNKNG